MAKLYFCAGCGVLVGNTDPENDETAECSNCGEAFDSIGAISGDFTDEAAYALINAGSDTVAGDDEDLKEDN